MRAEQKILFPGAVRRTTNSTRLYIFLYCTVFWLQQKIINRQFLQSLNERRHSQMLRRRSSHLHWQFIAMYLGYGGNAAIGIAFSFSGLYAARQALPRQCRKRRTYKPFRRHLPAVTISNRHGQMMWSIVQTENLRYEKMNTFREISWTHHVADLKKELHKQQLQFRSPNRPAKRYLFFRMESDASS